ncbi:ARM repeat-containing protein [Microthyrium microscopicum]|uniref:ARM repeat-containing protein n=1 Tax=Microthyrium microscopicum TaxID=703497 RepID=A0A6A6UB13_9PEZI|nr:ARM repeat-containing protein [Microthyrium microscopicum]
MALPEKRKSQSFAPASKNQNFKKQKTANPAPKKTFTPSTAPLRKDISDDTSDFEGFDDEQDKAIPVQSHKKREDAPANGQDDPNKSRESHKKQKEQAAARKAAKPNADEIARAKKLWERLRLKSHVQKDERQKLLTELFEIITGRVHDFVFKHDSVRIIQCAVKYSTIARKKEIARELKGTYIELAKSKYAKFLLAKIITEGDNETKAMIIPEFYGHIRRLINDPEASWILDDMYRSVASKSQKAIMLREFYGPEFAVFKSAEPTKVSADLSTILKASPEKRTPILQYLHERINQLVQKKMTGFTILHDAMLEYFLNISPESEDFTAFLNLVIGDNNEEEADLLKNLAFTSSGSQVVCYALAYGNAKQRRQILKAYKDVYEMLAFDKHGHQVLLTAFEVLDDTREIKVRVYNELVLLTKTATADDQDHKIINLATNQIGRASLLYPFMGPSGRLLYPDVANFMKKIQDIRSTTSKKDESVRRSELVEQLSPLCMHTIETRPDDLINRFGCPFISEIFIAGLGDKAAACKAIADLCQGDLSEESHISHSPFAAKTLKLLIQGGPYDTKAEKVIPLDPPLHFADTLLDVIEPQLSSWVTGDGIFVVLALLEAQWKDEKRVSVVKKSVKASASELKKIMKEGESLDKDAKGEEQTQKRKKATAAKHLLEAI